MTYATVTPLWRDYRSAKEARTAWESGADFLLHDPRSIWDGKPCNLEDLSTSSDYTHVRIRYRNRACVTVVKL